MRRLAADSDVSLGVMQQGYQSRDARGLPNVKGHLRTQQGLDRPYPTICSVDESTDGERDGGEQGWAGMSSMR